ncbi:hypothetical protein CI102_8 [Trichoderma harzianum]|uniref:Uncharacterized protein n=1 Tax=Trichoderma harzianum CBS 226.95 TaxID=983964 RepID=A0A2T4A555_TRIHA|nr:hypothetical protein M431DRAFT_510309 [Trichoderma harzianum CBS 226.95]PKK55218.1 hypothetical protein CI102_8 [Trichoderma harzianum]PTB52103.1 hypothetical protein M431DRAFT_510309 [Trichoderma harzianum CBS 226.95]
MENTILAHRRSLAEMRTELDGLDAALTVGAATKRSETISCALKVGTDSLYDLSALISGDFELTHDDGRLNVALDRLVATFDHITELADSQLAEVGRLHSDAIELRNAKLRPLQDKLDESKSELEAQLTRNREAITATSNTVNVLQESVDTMNRAHRSLQDKLSEAERVHDGVNIAVSILIPIWGIVGLIDNNASPGAVFNLRNCVNEARDALHREKMALEKAGESLKSERQQHVELENQVSRLQAMLSEIVPLENQVTATIEKTDMLQQAIIVVKQQLAAAAQRAAQLSNTVLITAHASSTKQEICTGILDIAEQVPLDFRNSNEMKLLLNELLSGYGSAVVPAAIESRANELLGVAAKYPSIEWHPTEVVTEA